MIIEYKEEIRRLKAQIRYLRRAATRDHLTGLPNKREFDDVIIKKISHYLRENEKFYVAIVDLDFFKRVNDQKGHLAGDRYLKRFALTLSKSIRAEDWAFRYAGDEFVLILNNNTDVNTLGLRIIADIRAAGFSASIGIAECRQSDTAKTLFERADKKLYEAKKHRNCLRV